MTSGLGAIFAYGLLTVLWGTILAIYMRQRRAARGDALITLLLSVLALDAFKTVVESVYFGLVWAANYGFLPEPFRRLGDPVPLTLVKLLNIGVAVVVLVWLVRRWVPAELARREAQRLAELKLTEDLEASLRAARESEERFRLAVSASRDFVWDHDLRTGATFSSARFAETLGYTASEWTPTSAQLLSVVHPDDLGLVRRELGAVLKGNVPVYEVRHRAVHKKGAVLHLISSGVVVRDAAGIPVRFVGFSRDVTAEVAAEADRVQVQKLESLGLLAGGIAHDFNNLLTVLSASLSLAESQALRGQSVTEHLDTAALAVKRATALTRQLLAYAGRSKLSQVPLNLNLLVSAMGELLTVSVPRKVKLVRVLQDQLPLVLGDEGQLQQVVMNLITNAAEAIAGEEGTVTLKTEALTLDATPPDVTGPAPWGSVVRLTVSDTGSGMTPDVKARICDPFFSTKGPGRGLGLAALAGILRTHGGAIGLSSEVGRGTTFSVYLPALPESTVLTPTPVPATSHPFLARVLLVDDEPLLRRSASRLLRSLGCTVEEAGTGVEALAKVREAKAPFDVVLMDVTMPEMDGYEAAHQMAKLWPTLPVILSSGYSSAESRSLPGVRALAKPYDRKRLESVLRDVLKPSEPAAKG